jgi:hypothetical protein
MEKSPGPHIKQPPKTLDRDFVERRRRTEGTMGIKVRTLEEAPNPHINAVSLCFEKRLPGGAKARRSHKV